MLKKILVVVLVISMMITMVACGSASDTNKLDEIKENGKIVLGTAADYPPYEFHKIIDGEDQIVGFDIEIAKEIAKEIGVELEIIDMRFEGLLPAIATGDIDFIVAGMVAEPEREEVVDFSIPYYDGRQKMLIRLEDKDKFINPEDLVGLPVGAQKATTQEDVVTNKFSESEYVGISKITDLVLELQNDRIDAVILAEPVAVAYEKQNTDLYMAEVDLGGEEGISAAVKKGDTELLEVIDAVLQRLIDDGSIDRFIAEASELAETE